MFVQFPYLKKKNLTNNHTPTALPGKKRKRKKPVNDTASFQKLKGSLRQENKATCLKTIKSIERLSHDAMAAILVFQNNETADMLVSCGS